MPDVFAYNYSICAEKDSDCEPSAYYYALEYTRPVVQLNSHDHHRRSPRHVRHQVGTAGAGKAVAKAAAARVDGSVVLVGKSTGTFASSLYTTDGESDFAAVAIDENGQELWRWQVLKHPLVHAGMCVFHSVVFVTADTAPGHTTRATMSPDVDAHAVAETLSLGSLVSNDQAVEISPFQNRNMVWSTSPHVLLTVFCRAGRSLVATNCTPARPLMMGQ